MSGITIAQLIIDDSSDKTITGVWVFDSANGGSLAIPSGNSFPASPNAGEIFWRTDLNTIYRRNDSNTVWEAIAADLYVSGQSAGSMTYYDGYYWSNIPAGDDGYVLTSSGGLAPVWRPANYGNIIGPGSSINNSIVLFDGYTGEIIKDSTVIIDGYGNISNAGTINSINISSHGSRHNPGGADSLSTASAVNVGTTNSEGTASSFARSDHTHAVTGLSISGQASGDLLYFNGSSWLRLPAGTDGYVLATHGTGIPTWNKTLSLTSSTPQNVTKSAALVGTDGYAARADHKHDISTAAASTLTVGGSNSEGTSTSLARADHTHALPAFGTTAGTFTQGNDSRLSDDRTASGLRTATTIVSVSGATAPVTGQVLTATSGTAATWQTPAASGVQLTSSAPQNVTKSAASVGTDGYAARSDHKHDISTAAASTINIAGSNSEGTATTLARSDHTHSFTVTSQAQGDVLYYNGSAWTRLAASTDGYVLTTHGAGQNPTWAQASGSGGISIPGQQQGDIIYYNGTTWTRLPASTDGYVLTTHSTGQNPTWVSQNKRRVTVEYCLTEDVNNNEKYFYTWKTTVAGTDSERSGNNGGLQNANSCSPYQVPFNGTIIKAILTLKGAGVQSGSVSYPVTYQTDLFDIGFYSESKVADIDFTNINSGVQTYSPGNTDYKGSTNLNISVTECQMLGLKFINGSASNLVGQSRNAFVTLIIEES